MIKFPKFLTNFIAVSVFVAMIGVLLVFIMAGIAEEDFLLISLTFIGTACMFYAAFQIFKMF